MDRTGPKPGLHTSRHSSRHSPPLPMKQILFIDDNRMLRDRLTAPLRDAGYQLQFVADEFEAHERLRSPAPDLLLIDLDLQSTSSWDLYAAWKARHPELRTVAVTGTPNRFGITSAVGID